MLITGSEADLKAIRAKVSQLLGLPKEPDTIGRYVTNAVPTTHEHAIFEVKGVFYMSVDDILERMSADVRMTKAMRTKLASLCVMKIDSDAILGDFQKGA